MPDTKPLDRSDQHHQQLRPVKRIFGYFFCNRKKSLASASAAGGETAFEFDVEVEVEVEVEDEDEDEDEDELKRPGHAA